MRLFTKTIARLLILIICVSILPGCKNQKLNEANPNIDNDVSAVTSPVVKVPEDIGDSVNGCDPDEDIKFGDDEITDTNQVDMVELSDDWKNLDVAIDGVVYAFPYEYDKLVENGWTMDLAEYGYEDGYVMSSDDRTYSIVELCHDDYGSDYNSFTIWCGFKNYNDQAADITECDVWTIEFDAMFGWDLIEELPNVQIAQGIHFGSTGEDVIAAFGKPDEIYKDKNRGYKTYEYSYEYDKYMNITVFEEYGVTCIELKSYCAQ